MTLEKKLESYCQIGLAALFTVAVGAVAAGFVRAAVYFWEPAKPSVPYDYCYTFVPDGTSRIEVWGHRTSGGTDYRIGVATSLEDVPAVLASTRCELRGSR